MDRFELRSQDFSLDEDQLAVRAAFADFFAKECPPETVRGAEPRGFDADLWGRLLTLGVGSMSLPTTAGGDDATLVDLVLIAEELGRVLAPVPLISHVVATRMLERAGAPASLISAAARGDFLVTLAHAPVTGGARQLVPDAAVATHVVALLDDKLVLLSADGPGAHVSNQGCTPLAWWRPTDGHDRTVLAAGAKAGAIHTDAVAEWRLLTAAALVGMADAALRLGVEFAKTRRTLGVPIGSLQGISFPLVDIAVGVGGTRHLVWKAAWYAQHEPGSRPELPLMAFDAASRTATHGTSASAHVHGGLGFSVEADISLYFLRAKGWSLLGGSTSANLREIGSVIAGAA
ncbi:acyl-CoA dehydrogenase family protein [Pseudonocardia oroxyli]|uniref:Acyl-CoA dehydrogenase n=1 Tax=Pseudonocardia oroxyli TaxID=366584 RepID=A0A1G8DXL8_PSEOR|nr:acyl-CoA dehydrogenase family protein [Pseudonocardia oroxyli]SDH62424.1 Acyl-CoA dehydrogenase [Pseudonocardia oroxyli]